MTDDHFDERTTAEKARAARRRLMSKPEHAAPGREQDRANREKQLAYLGMKVAAAALTGYGIARAFEWGL